MRFLKIIAYTSTIIWTLIGLLIIASIVNSTIDFIINIVMGLIFIAIAYFLYAKTQNSLDLLRMNTNDNKIQIKFLKLESIFFVLSFLLGLILLSGTISRVFYVKMAVFG